MMKKCIGIALLLCTMSAMVIEASDPSPSCNTKKNRKILKLDRRAGAKPGSSIGSAGSSASEAGSPRNSRSASPSKLLVASREDSSSPVSAEMSRPIDAASVASSRRESIAASGKEIAEYMAQQAQRPSAPAAAAQPSGASEPSSVSAYDPMTSTLSRLPAAASASQEAGGNQKHRDFVPAGASMGLYNQNSSESINSSVSSVVAPMSQPGRPTAAALSSQPPRIPAAARAGQTSHGQNSQEVIAPLKDQVLYMIWTLQTITHDNFVRPTQATPEEKNKIVQTSNDLIRYLKRNELNPNSVQYIKGQLSVLLSELGSSSPKVQAEASNKVSSIEALMNGKAVVGTTDEFRNRVEIIKVSE